MSERPSKERLEALRQEAMMDERESNYQLRDAFVEIDALTQEKSRIALDALAIDRENLHLAAALREREATIRTLIGGIRLVTSQISDAYAPGGHRLELSRMVPAAAIGGALQVMIEAEAALSPKEGV